MILKKRSFMAFIWQVYRRRGTRHGIVWLFAPIIAGNEPDKASRAPASEVSGDVKPGYI